MSEEKQPLRMTIGELRVLVAEVWDMSIRERVYGAEVQRAVDAAVTAERAACLAIAEEHAAQEDVAGADACARVAERIRARGVVPLPAPVCPAPTEGT